MSFVIAPSLLIVTINGTILIVGYLLNIYKSQTRFNLFHREIKLHRRALMTFRLSFITKRLAVYVLSISMGCKFYEYTYHSQWERTYNKIIINDTKPVLQQ